MNEGASKSEHDSPNMLSRLAGFFRHGVKDGHHHGERSASKRPLGRTIATLAMAGLLAFSTLVTPLQAQAYTSTTSTTTSTSIATQTAINTAIFVIIMSSAADNSRNAATRAPAEYTAMPDYLAFKDSWAVNTTGLGMAWHDDGELNYTLGDDRYDRDMSGADAQQVFEALQADEDFMAVGDKAVVNIKGISKVAYDDGELKISVNGYDKDIEIDAAAAGKFLSALAEHEDYTRLANGTVVQTDLITKADFNARKGELTVSVMSDDVEVDLSADQAADFMKTLAEKDNYARLNATTVINVNLPTLFSYDGDDVTVYTGSSSKDFETGANEWQALRADLAERDHYVELPGGKKGGMLNVFNVDYAYYDRDDAEMRIYAGSTNKDVDMTQAEAEAFFKALGQHDRFHAVDADHVVNNRSVQYASVDDEDLDIKVGKSTRTIDMGNNANAKAAMKALQDSDEKFRIFPEDDGKENLVNTKAMDRAWFSKGFWWWPWDDDNMKYHVGETTFWPDYSEEDTKAYFNDLVKDKQHIVDSNYGPVNAMAITEVWYDDGELKFRIGSSTYSADASDQTVREFVGGLLGVDLPESYDYDAMSKKGKDAPESPKRDQQSSLKAVRPRG